MTMTAAETPEKTPDPLMPDIPQEAHRFAAMLAHIDRLDDEDFTKDGVSHEHVTSLRQRI